MSDIETKDDTVKVEQEVAEKAPEQVSEEGDLHSPHDRPVEDPQPPLGTSANDYNPYHTGSHPVGSAGASSSANYGGYDPLGYDYSRSTLDTLAAAADANSAANAGDYMPYSLDSQLGGFAQALNGMGMNFGTPGHHASGSSGGNNHHDSSTSGNAPSSVRHAPYHFNHSSRTEDRGQGEDSQQQGDLEHLTLDINGQPVLGGANAKLQDDKQRKRIMQACEPCRIRKAKVSDHHKALE